MDQEWLLEALNIGIDLERHPRLVTFLQEKARNGAITALRELCIVDPMKTDRVAFLQSEVVRYSEMVGWIAQAAEDARIAQGNLDDAQRAELHEIVAQDGQINDA